MAKKVKVTNRKTVASKTSGGHYDYKSGKVKVTNNKTKSKSYVSKGDRSVSINDTHISWTPSGGQDKTMSGSNHYHPTKASKSVKSVSNRKRGVTKTKTVREVFNNKPDSESGSYRMTRTKSTPKKSKTVSKTYNGNGKTIKKTVKKVGKPVRKTIKRK